MKGGRQLDRWYVNWQRKDGQHAQECQYASAKCHARLVVARRHARKCVARLFEIPFQCAHKSGSQRPKVHSLIFHLLQQQGPGRDGPLDDGLATKNLFEHSSSQKLIVVSNRGLVGSGPQEKSDRCIPLGPIRLSQSISVSGSRSTSLDIWMQSLNSRRTRWCNARKSFRDTIALISKRGWARNTRQSSRESGLCDLISVPIFCTVDHALARNVHATIDINVRMGHQFAHEFQGPANTR